MKRKLAYALTIAAAVIFIIFALMEARAGERADGRAHGYTTGYSIGYADFLNGKKQNGLKLAGQLAPYEPGTLSWKYFIMGFDEGYDDGFSGEMIWNTNAP